MSTAAALHQRIGVLPRRTSIWLARAGIGAFACVMLLLNLTHWPDPWFDEGIHTAAADTLAKQGVYGLPNGPQTRELDPYIQTTGPAVVLPMALAFKVFGAGLLQARSVMVVYALLTLGAFYLLARALGGEAPALLATLVLVAGNNDSFTSFIPMARQALSEAPALGWYCLGTWIFVRAVRSDRFTVWTAIGAGVLCGVGMTSKSQMAVTLPVALFALLVLNWWRYRAVSTWLIAVMLASAIATVACWSVAQLLLVGLDTMRANNEVVREGFATHVAQLSVQGPRTAMGVIARSGFLLWGVPGLACAAVLARPRTKEGFIQSIPLAFILVWIAWFSILSIGWSRYAAVPFMLTAIYSGRLIRDLMANAGVSRSSPARVAGNALLLAMVSASIVFGVQQLDRAATANDDDSAQFASWLSTNVPVDARIESWEWELDVLAPHHFTRPALPVLLAYIEEKWSGGSVDPDIYDPALRDSDYVIVGPMASWTGIYADDIRDHGVLVMRTKRYALYELRH